MTSPTHAALGLLAALIALFAISRRWARRPGGGRPWSDPASPSVGLEPPEPPSAPPDPLRSNLLDVLHDAVYSLSPDHRVLTWNAAAERIYGWAAREAIGVRVQDLLNTRFSDGESADEVAREIDRSGHVRREAVQTRRDGTDLFVEAHVVAVRDGAGAVAGQVVVSHDVSARKRAEEALSASEAKFRASFHGSGLAMALLDAEGRLLEHNRGLREMLGYTDAELRGLSLRNLLHPDDADTCTEELRVALEQGKDLLLGERRYVRSDGRVVQALLRLSIVRDAGGRFLHLVALLEDVTQKKALEAKLVFSDRMASIGTLAAGVGHEINNPLSFILSNLKYVAEELSKINSVPADVVDAIEETRAGAVRVREIVRDLKTFSRADDRCEDEPIDVRSILQSSINLTSSEIRHRARLVLELEEVPLVTASPHRLGQVFVNLLINAAQAVADGRADHEQIRVRCAARADGWVQVEVGDTGRGIAPENIDRIFEPFFTTKPFGVGTGLGLSICHGIVTRLGGRLEVESEVGRGSTFRVTLPPAGNDAPASTRRTPAAPSVASPEVLVVDDEPMIGTAITRILGAEHRVTFVENARAALAHIASSPSIGAIVCDLQMPEMDGMELYDALVASRPEMAARVVFLTGGAFTPRARDFLTRVTNPRLDKPFDAEALRMALRRVSPASP